MTLVLVLAKRCHRCAEVKAVSAFYVDRHRSDGYTSACRACSLAAANAYYASNREQVLARAAARYRLGRRAGS